MGNAKGVAKFIDKHTEQFDMAGKVVLPDFVSGHDHLLTSQWMNYGVDLYLEVVEVSLILAMPDGM